MEDEIRPKMKSDERRFFSKYLKSSRIYLEFGCGGSTVFASESRARAIYSVETDIDWINKCKAHPSIASRLERNEIHFFFADVGETGRWGKPVSRKERFSWPLYSIGVWLQMPKLPDLVLVDGRWRVACALQALLRCENTARILVHDWDRRPDYHQLLEFADLEEQAGSLVALAPKPGRDRGVIAIRALDQVADYS